MRRKLIDVHNETAVVIAVATIAATVQSARLAAGDRFERAEVTSEACVDEAIRIVLMADRAVERHELKGRTRDDAAPEKS